MEAKETMAHYIWRKTLSAQLLILVLFQTLINGTNSKNLSDIPQGLRGSFSEQGLTLSNDSTIESDRTTNERVLSQNGIVDDILSSTLSIRLDPVQHIYQMDDLTASIFESGMFDFLKSHFSLTEDYGVVNILSVTITRSNIDHTRPKSFQNANPMMQLEVVVTGQTTVADSSISDEIFGEAIVNICSDKETEFIMDLKDAEKKMIINRVDISEDRLVFNPTTEIIVEIHFSNNENDGIAVDAVVIVSTAVAIIFVKMTVFWFFCKKRAKHDKIGTKLEKTESPSNVRETRKKGRKIRKQKKVYESVQTNESADVPSMLFERNRHTRRSNGPAKDNSSVISKNDHDEECFNFIPSGDSDTDCFSKSSDYSDLSSIHTADINHTSTLQSECYAPAGKLGIAIDTVNGQPVIHRVKDTSPLFGVLRRLDIIIAVDEVDTSSMSAAAVTSLMAKHMAKERKITFLRGEGAMALLQ